jgi:hypothetical protein
MENSYPCFRDSILEFGMVLGEGQVETNRERKTRNVKICETVTIGLAPRNQYEYNRTRYENTST